MTSALEELTEKLQDVEAYLKDSLVPFLRTIFRRFYEHRGLFSNAVGCIAELDCLCTLAAVSADESQGPMCKPEILAWVPGETPVLEIKQMRHPCY